MCLKKNIKSFNFKNDGFPIEYFFDINQDAGADFGKFKLGSDFDFTETIILSENFKASFNYIKGNVPFHNHNYYEVDIVISGEIVEYTNTSETMLKSNDMIIVSPENFHAYKRPENLNHTIFLNLSLKKEFFVGKLQKLINHNFPQYISIEQYEIDMIIQLLMTVYNAPVSLDDFSVPLLKENAFNYIVTLLFSKAINSNNISSSNDITTTTTNNGIIAAIAFINNNYDKKISCETVSKKFGYSASYFSSKFKKTTGFSFSEYVTKLRLERVKHLLLMTNLTVKKIVIDSGFNSMNYFSNLFKNTYGMTATEYRDKFKMHGENK